MEPKLQKSELGLKLESVNEKAAKWKNANCIQRTDQDHCFKMQRNSTNYNNDHKRLRKSQQMCIKMINFDQISPNTIEEYYMCMESIENSYKDLTQYYFELFNE